MIITSRFNAISDQKDKAGFSLVEILVVLAISSILLAITGLNLGKIKGSNSLLISGNIVSDIANLARQNAVSKNKLTAIIIGKNADQENGNYFTTMFEINPESELTTEKKPWKQIHKWEPLPAGITILESTFPNSSERVSYSFPPLRYLNQDLDTYYYVIFLPNGSLTIDTTVRLRLSKIENNHSEKPTNPKNYIDIYILAQTGRVKFDQP